MAGKDNFFKARMTDEQMQTLEAIVKEIQAATPEANVTASSIARYALEKYIDDYRAERDGTAIVVRVSMEELSSEDIRGLDKKLQILIKEIKDSDKENISKVLGIFRVNLLKSALAKIIRE